MRCREVRFDDGFESVVSAVAAAASDSGFGPGARLMSSVMTISRVDFGLVVI